VYALCLPPSLFLSLSLSLPLSLSLSLPLSLSPSLSLFLSLSLPLSLPLSLSLSLPPSFSISISLSLSFSHSLSHRHGLYNSHCLNFVANDKCRRNYIKCIPVRNDSSTASVPARTFTQRECPRMWETECVCF